MTLGNRCIVAKNENFIRCYEIQKASMSKTANQLRQQNRKIKGRKVLNTTTIELMTPLEPSYKADYMGKCDCGCKKDLYKGMSVICHGSMMIHIDCLEAYLKRNLVVL